MVLRPRTTTADPAGTEHREEKKTNPVFKILSEAFLRSKKHSRALRKILAAYLKENWERLYPHWKDTSGYQLASDCCSRLATGVCNWPVAVNVAAHLVQTSIFVSSSNAIEQCFGPGSSGRAIRIFTSFNEENGEPNFKFASECDQDPLSDCPTTSELVPSSVPTSPPVPKDPIKMAPSTHMASGVLGTGSTPAEPTDTTRCETTEMAAPCDELQSAASKAQPSSEHTPLPRGGQRGPRLGPGPAADAASADPDDSGGGRCTPQPASADVNKPGQDWLAELVARKRKLARCKCGEMAQIFFRRSRQWHVDIILEKIFLKSPSSTWLDIGKWHDLHMVSKRYWLDRPLSKLQPVLQTKLGSEEYRIAEAIFSVHQNHIKGLAESSSGSE